VDNVELEHIMWKPLRVLNITRIIGSLLLGVKGRREFFFGDGFEKVRGGRLERHVLHIYDEWL